MSPRLRLPGQRTILRAVSRVRSVAAGPEVSPRRIRQHLAELRDTPLPRLADSPATSLAVVVPCYGHAAYVPTMLRSLAAQTRLPDEVILVVDASPDDTAAILREAIAALGNGRGAGSAGSAGSAAADALGNGLGPRCRLLVNERNVGQAASINRAVEAASSDLVAILNDDDYLLHDAVATLLALFAEHPELALIGAHSQQFRTDADLEGLPLTVAEQAGGRPVPLAIRQPAEVPGYRRYNDLNMTHSGSCFRRAAWAVAGGYRPDRDRRVVPFSDRDFQLRVNALFPVGVCAETAFSLWRVGSSVDHGLNS